jgi:hypothetical protein
MIKVLTLDPVKKFGQASNQEQQKPFYVLMRYYSSNVCPRWFHPDLSGFCGVGSKH